MKVIIDSSAWIEYLEGSELGEKVRDLLVRKEEVYIMNIMIAEVVSKVKRKEGNFDIAYRAMVSNAKVINLTPEISKEAGLLHAEMKKKMGTFGLVDALILTVARTLKAKILTKDNHFKGFKEAYFLE